VLQGCTFDADNIRNACVLVVSRCLADHQPVYRPVFGRKKVRISLIVMQLNPTYRVVYSGNYNVTSNNYRRQNPRDTCTVHMIRNSVSQKNPPCGFLKFFPKRSEMFNQFFTHVLHEHFYTRLQIFIQLSPTLTKL